MQVLGMHIINRHFMVLNWDLLKLFVISKWILWKIIFTSSFEGGDTFLCTKHKLIAFTFTKP